MWHGHGLCDQYSRCSVISERVNWTTRAVIDQRLGAIAASSGELWLLRLGLSPLGSLRCLRSLLVERWDFWSHVLGAFPFNVWSIRLIADALRSRRSLLDNRSLRLVADTLRARWPFINHRSLRLIADTIGT